MAGAAWQRGQERAPGEAPRSSPRGRTGAEPREVVQLQRALGNRGVQALAQGGRDASILDVAGAGLRGAPRALPYLDKVQAAFGRHDVRGVRAFVGGEAASANQALGASAYTMGASVAFRGAPDLHTAAHEAAHVVQQRSGVSFKGALGEEGGADERHADAVADAVVAGRSAEALLDARAPSPSGGGAVVQRQRYHGVGGWIHQNIYEPAQAYYDQAIAANINLAAEWNAQVPVLGYLAGSATSMVNITWYSLSKIIVGALQLVTPLTEEDHFLLVASGGMAAPAMPLMHIGRYLIGILGRHPRLLVRLRLDGVRRLFRLVVEGVVEFAERSASAIGGHMEPALAGAGAGRTPSAMGHAAPALEGTMARLEGSGTGRAMENLAETRASLGRAERSLSRTASAAQNLSSRFASFDYEASGRLAASVDRALIEADRKGFLKARGALMDLRRALFRYRMSGAGGESQALAEAAEAAAAVKRSDEYMRLIKILEGEPRSFFDLLDDLAMRAQAKRSWWPGLMR